MNITDYRQHPAWSYSKLKPYLKSALHGLFQTPFAETAAMRFGSAVDLGMKNQLDEVIVNPFEDGRTKAAKEFKQTNEGKLVLSESEFSRTLNCIAALKSHPAVKELNLHMLQSDVPLFGEFEGLALKGLPDWSFGGTVVDLKTTSSAVSASEFAKTVDNFHYDLQAAIYCELAKQAGDTNPTFFWIAVESEHPHDVAVFKATERILEVGYAKLRHALNNVRKAQTDTHLGTQQFITELEMPAWYGSKF